MTMEPNPTQDALDWQLEGSASFFPPFLDYPYPIQDYHFWDQSQDIISYHNQIDPATGYPNTGNGAAAVVATTATSTTCTTPSDPEPYSYNNLPVSDLPTKKRNSAGDNECSVQKPSQHHRAKKFKARSTNEADNGDSVAEGISVRKSGGNRKGGGKNNGNSCNNGNKEGRWAEQLLIPCASAITARNLNRVQHLLYVLHELASPTGDPNHRLAAHGLRALTNHLSSSSSTTNCTTTTDSGTMTFASVDSKFFNKALLKFYEASPWFSFPNNIANASILQLLAEEESSSPRTLHILDIGVSHGVQWPTFLEALTRRPGGPPPLVRLTVVTASSNENEQNMEAPFSVGPPGDNSSSYLLGYAQSLKLNMQINTIDNLELHNLNSKIIDTSSDETFIVCAQFRLHHLNHKNPDERSEFLKTLRSMEPKGVILNDNNTECSCNGCGSFAAGFSRRVEYLWSFLDSTSVAFKGRESEERRVMEGEAAKALTNQREMNEGKEKWCERMKEAGFVEGKLDDDTIDGAKALLRKYDNNWEMKVEEGNKSVGLFWKDQPVSFCSLWKLDGGENQGRSSSTLNSRL
ncbi:FG-nucleoporin nsp1 [Stylosanthes scabra]|uniref:FG-nucleoporin nsp1 n=1 Tax=Stylosanthes scabra TaxID=79078 RepID=A0ABU6Y3L6_9FABA|nr:FG-nucleoporin nsp1 [Stylosanthes scabra]